MKNTNDQLAVLFDLDGTLIDTEPQYSLFWKQIGIKYLHIDNLHHKIRGSSLSSTLDNYFPGQEELHKLIIQELDTYEASMTFPFIEGAIDFVKELRSQGVKLAIVTSSDKRKMQYVFKAHPFLSDMFDIIAMAGDYQRSKPDPECFVYAAHRLNIIPENCFVFEDSLLGLEAGNRANMHVIGIDATLNNKDVEKLASLVISDYNNISLSSLLTLKKTDNMRRHF